MNDEYQPMDQNNLPQSNSNTNHSSGQSDQGGGYQQSNNNNQGGGQQAPAGGNYSKEGGSGGGKKSNIPMTPYIAYGLIIKSDALADIPTDARERLNTIINICNNKGLVLRRTFDVTGKDFYNTLQSQKTEVVLPWWKFEHNNEEVSGDVTPSKHNKTLLMNIDERGETMHKGVISWSTQDIATLLGGFNTSPLRFLLIYSADGAEGTGNIGKSTGYVSSTIKYATKLGIPVYNLNNTDLVDRLTNVLSGITA